MASFTQRLIGAAKLDVHTYEEVEADGTATSQAMGVVAPLRVARSPSASRFQVWRPVWAPPASMDSLACWPL